MVEDARAIGVSAFRQVTQRFPSGLELPIEYTTVRLGGQAGLIAIGKNLQAVAELQSRLIAAQHAREQDYWKLREIETRSRLLFDASNEAGAAGQGREPAHRRGQPRRHPRPRPRAGLGVPARNRAEGAGALPGHAARASASRAARRA